MKIIFPFLFVLIVNISCYSQTAAERFMFATPNKDTLFVKEKALFVEMNKIWDKTTVSGKSKRPVIIQIDDLTAVVRRYGKNN